MWSINSLRAELTWSRAAHAGFTCAWSLVQSDGLQAPFPAQPCTSDLNPDYNTLMPTHGIGPPNTSVVFSLLLSLQDETSGACKIRNLPCACSERQLVGIYVGLTSLVQWSVRFCIYIPQEAEIKTEPNRWVNVGEKGKEEPRTVDLLCLFTSSVRIKGFTKMCCTFFVWHPACCKQLWSRNGGESQLCRKTRRRQKS